MTPEQRKEAIAAWPEWWGEAKYNGKAMTTCDGSPSLHHWPDGWWVGCGGFVTASYGTPAEAVAEAIAIFSPLAGLSDAQARIDRALAILRARTWVADGEDPDPADFVSMDADCERAIAILEGGE